MSRDQDETPPVDSRLVGLLVVAAIILAIILVRWGHHIPWGIR